MKSGPLTTIRQVAMLGALLLVCTLACFSQDDHSKLSASFSFGPSFPLGKFADKSANPQYAPVASGWAKVGYGLNLGLNYVLRKNAGLSLSISGQENFQDSKALDNQLKTALSGVQTDSSKSFSAAGPWKIGKILLGGYFSIPLDQERISLRFQVLAGALKTSIPSFHYSYSAWYIDSSGLGLPSSVNGTASQGPRSLSWAFCYQLDASLKWKIAPRAYFCGGIYYFHSSPSISGTTYTYSTTGGGGLYGSTGAPTLTAGPPFTTHYPILALNLYTGLEFNL